MNVRESNGSMQPLALVSEKMFTEIFIKIFNKHLRSSARASYEHISIYASKSSGETLHNVFNPLQIKQISLTMTIQSVTHKQEDVLSVK